MDEFVAVAKTGEIPDGEGRTYPVNGKMVAIFNLSGEYLAINDLCPHMGASLSAGYVEDGQVSCPWHAWRFRLTDGKWMDNPKSDIKTDCYEVKVEETDILVRVPAPESSSDVTDLAE
ncbi:3-phenylpropionate/cinnamic acid dioxygenase ferredoxin subunit [Thalassoglobus neptunius]|uniref:3-phenylpropionate/cinnamic acid dioxygenase ferredoxin subunit n=1 Tax=Thalassoglobus neptunius TaxID=1938619 RepID=A0A5C5WAB6_9PLAN|nr:Rieske 2Fe-2S domain-containing protein [Thalassoglobus neptunius]TWT47095.1 3-phenylpropionate/cinnamic acid dioxygenase ferredoxin subunit [Thalassoglobus neptunius]